MDDLIIHVIMDEDNYTCNWIKIIIYVIIIDNYTCNNG